MADPENAESTALIEHKLYYWVKTKIQDEYKQLKAQQVAERYGVPAKELFCYWEKEIDCDKAVQTLPRTLSLIIFFALMLLSHEMLGPAQSIERAIRFDIEENANFAFNGAGTFGNKNLQDVNSFADFYSWFRLGFAAIYMPTTSSVSEGSSITAANLTPLETSEYLNFNRKLGPVKLSQSKAKVVNCENPDLFASISIGDDTRCFDQAHEFYIQPTDFDVGFLEYVEDENVTVWLSYSDPTSKIERLERTSWLTKDTNHWQVTFVIYNPDYDILTVTNIHFLLARSGRIWKQITFLSLKTRPYANLWSLCWEILFFGSIVTIFVEEVYEVITGLLAARTGGKCRPMQFIREYLGIWNAVDWVSIIIAFTLLGMWIVTCLDRAELEDLVTTLSNACADHDDEACSTYQELLLDKTMEAGLLAGHTSLVSSFYPFCILLRLFKTFSLQPRLAVVTRTLWTSVEDLAHFGIIFLSVFVTFVFMAMGFFGRTVPGYSNFNIAFVTLFRALMGDLDFDAMEEQAGRIIAGIFHIAFMLTMLLILLNMLIAIIMDVYAMTKQTAAHSDPVWHDVYDYFSRLYQRRTGHRMNIWNAKIKCMAALQDKNDDKHEGFGKSNTSFFGVDVTEDKDTIITFETLKELVPDMSDEQAMSSIDESVQWFAKTTEVTVNNQEMLQGIRQLQMAAGIDLQQSTGARTSKIGPDFDAMEGINEKVQDIAQNDLKDLLKAAQWRLEKMEAPSRTNDILAQMVASVRMVQDEQVVDMRL